MIDLTRAKRISGWMNDNELTFLAKIAELAEVSIEIGSYYGRSCMAIADNTKGVVYSVDPYKGEYVTANPTIHLDFDDDVYNTFKYNLSEHLASGKLEHFRGVFPDFPVTPADFVFIDGDHSYEGCMADIKHALTMMNHNGVVAGHDYGTPGFTGVKQSADEIFGDKIHVVDTIWWAQV
jgi:predicted O-methyltransferase YrrM